MIEDAGLTLLPALFDSHEHLLESARNLGRVRAEDARSLDQLIRMLAERAANTPPGQWVETSMGWNESNLAERRLPTAAELDRASDTHPVLVPRGGHVCVGNTLALRAAGITPDTPDPPGGTIGRLEDGALSGVLESWLAQKIKSLVPPPPLEESVADLADACRRYAALGVGSICEALVSREDWPVYQTAWERGLLCIRCRPMILVPIGSAEEDEAFVAGLGARSGFGDHWLRLWGLKFVMDGVVAGAGMEEPFANNPGSTGHINWDPDAMAPIVSYAIANGWKVAPTPSAIAPSAQCSMSMSARLPRIRARRPERSSSSTPFSPTPSSAHAPRAWVWQSPCSTRCSTPTAPTCWRAGVRNAPAR